MSVSDPSRYDLEEAAFDSMHKSAGFDPETAADLGFITPDNIEYQVDKAVRTAEEVRQTAAAQKAGQIICGDCCQVVPCGHATIDKKGSLKHLYS